MRKIRRMHQDVNEKEIENFLDWYRTKKEQILAVSLKCFFFLCSRGQNASGSWFKRRYPFFPAALRVFIRF